MKLPADNKGVPFGILPDQQVRVGDHIAYFWETAREFERGVEFLMPGLTAADHCVIFGHDAANRSVCELLEARDVDVKRFQDSGRLTVVGSETTGDATLAKLGGIFQKALDGGAPMIRLLGNIGWGEQGWPDEDDLLFFEGKVTGAVKGFPSVIVCMYDVGTLSGRAIVNGGFGTHPITVCGNVMRVNPYHVNSDRFIERVRDTAARRKAAESTR